MNWKVLVLVLLTAVEAWELLLTVIHMRSAANPIPANVADVYDGETYPRWRAYHGEKARFRIVTSLVSWGITLLLLVFNAHAAFAGLFPRDNPYLQVLAVLLLIALSELLMLPFTWHGTMVIEEKYGFNKTTPRTFWADQVREFLVSLALMCFLGYGIMGLRHVLNDWLQLGLFVLAAMGMILFFSFLFPLFTRIFNKFTPLEEGELRGRLTGLLEKHGYRVRDIKVMDASRRTTKSNAYFTGFGKLKTIVLYDTLVAAMTPEEICAVFAHELGHGLHRDVMKNQLLALVRIGLLIVLAWLTLRPEGLFEAFGFPGINDGFALLLILSVEFPLLSPLLGLLTNGLSRRAEYRADAFAVEEGYGAALVSALKKLARQNYADLAPSPLLVKLEYSHPTMSQRIAAIEAGGK